jgi:subtilisin family serine protease
LPPDDHNNTNHDAASKYTIHKEDVLADLDPDLQRIILMRRQGLPLPPHLVETVTEEDNQEFTAIDVIARLKHPGQTVPGLWVVQKIGPFVTGLVDVDRIEEVREQVDSLKAARPVQQTLSNSVPEINGSPAQIFAATGQEVDGSNVIIGIVDHNCDFAHPHFRSPDDGTTRILFLWDQREGTTPQSPADFGYGREFDAAAINHALENPEAGSEGPHHALGYPLSGGHGTRVMDIAAGNGGGQNPPGVAPGADIIFVHSSLGNLETDQSTGNSRYLVDAVQYIFNRASQLNRQAVVNISLSYDAGPHDGSTPVEQAFDSMLQTPGRAIVMAAGNSANNNKHVRRRIYPGETRTLLWNIQPNDETDNKVEIWYDGRRALELTLRLDQNIVIGPFPLGTTHTIRKTVDNEEQIAGHVFHRANDSGNGDNNIVVVLGPLMESGVWGLELESNDPPDHPPFDVDAWIERDFQISTFVGQRPSDGLCTLGTLACGFSTIAVSAYDTAPPHGIIPNSGAGPTRDGRLKPEVSAPGAGINAATILTNTVGPAGTGTSLSAPHVTGLIALLMDAAGTLLTIEEIRDFVLNPARHRPPSMANAWDPRFGAGRIDVAASISEALAIPPLPPSPHIGVFEHELIEAEFGGINISVETVSAIVAPLFRVFRGLPLTNGGSAESGDEDEEPSHISTLVTTDH